MSRRKKKDKVRFVPEGHMVRLARPLCAQANGLARRRVGFMTGERSQNICRALTGVCFHTPRGRTQVPLFGLRELQPVPPLLPQLRCQIGLCAREGDVHLVLVMCDWCFSFWIRSVPMLPCLQHQKVFAHSGREHRFIFQSESGNWPNRFRHIRRILPCNHWCHRRRLGTTSLNGSAKRVFTAHHRRDAGPFVLVLLLHVDHLTSAHAHRDSTES